MPTETLTTNAEYQAYQSFLNLPEVKPYIGMCGICTFEAPKGTIFSYKPVGTVTRSYLSVAANNFAELNTSFSSALLWE
jgi:20S proteasome alpha/beta subunit